MKRIFVFSLLVLLMAFQTGCQTGPFMNSQVRSGQIPAGLTEQEELAAYRQNPMPAVRKNVNDIPISQIPLASRPLGYRRGYHDCST